MTFPKIIHTIAPADKTKWHPIWNECYQSWFKHFDSAEFQFRMWSDEACDNFVKEHYNEFYDSYMSLHYKIMKFDIVRLLILHKFGGIYHDMDYFCYKNFFNFVCDKHKRLNKFKQYNFFIVENFNNGTKTEVLQNSLIISEKGNPFFYFAVDMALAVYDKFTSLDFFKNHLSCPDPSILALTGPVMLSHFFHFFMDTRKETFENYLLEENLFNPKIEVYNENLFTKHACTTLWINEIDKKSNEKWFQKKHIIFKDFDVSNINFFINYGINETNITKD